VSTGLLSTNLAGIVLRNPVVLAAGTAGVVDEMGDVLDLSQVGAVTTKSITPEARGGNATWRIVEAGRAGMLNAIGLANPGLDAFLEHAAPRAAGVACPVVVSVAGFAVADYVKVVANVEEWLGRHPLSNIAAFELNVSCPNVKTGVEFGGSPTLVSELVSAVRGAVPTAKLFVKLGPMTPELPLVALAAAKAGADVLTIGNTIPAMGIDVETRRPRLANVTGGLSGPGLHPVAVRNVYEVYRRVRGETGTPIVGVGGVMRWEDAAEFVLAGATAVGMGTGLFADPRSPLGVVRGLEKWVKRLGAANIGALVGAVEV
jgi:dihydroorotate dehydrogenase (NAD+) catalytic subunit